MDHIDFLKKEIQKTGFPLEIQISSLLDTEWQRVVNTDTYFDREGKRLRDIDINAYDILATQKIAPLGLGVNFSIECKKNEDFAWVFFTRPYQFDFEYIDGQYIDYVQIFSRNMDNDQVMQIVLGKTPLHYQQVDRVAVSYNEFCVNGKKSSYNKRKREIFTAQNQLKKYIDWSIEQLMGAISQFGLYPIEIFFPCIVFEGAMYEAIVENGNLQLKEADHIILDTSYRSRYSVYEKTILVDVVRRSYFEDYMKLIRKDVNSIKRIVHGQSQKITRKIEEITSLLGSKRKD